MHIFLLETTLPLSVLSPSLLKGGKFLKKRILIALRIDLILERLCCLEKNSVMKVVALCKNPFNLNSITKETRNVSIGHGFPRLVP